MVEQGYACEWHWVWSDGWVTQFKNNKPWYFVSRYPNLIRGCKVLWNCFGSNHGKRPHDGA